MHFLQNNVRLQCQSLRKRLYIHDVAHEGTMLVPVKGHSSLSKGLIGTIKANMIIKMAFNVIKFAACPV